MAVSMKRSRKSTTALVREVWPFVLMQLLISIHHLFYLWMCYVWTEYSLYEPIWYISISPVALWPDHSHLPAAPVKEAEGQTCPPVPWTTSLWGLLLSTAPGNTGQAARPFILCLHQNFWFSPHLCLTYFLFPSFCCNCFVIFLSPVSSSLRWGTPFISARMRTLWLWVLWTFAQTTLMIAHGYQSHSTHPREPEASQMDPVAETW